MTSGLRPFVSVVVPVFNQGPELLYCLRALAAQRYPRQEFEVIVVDNGSDPPIADLLPAFPFARGLSEQRPGSYAARNRGIDASRGEILAFTDADCVPAADWIERGVAAVRRLSGPGMVGGRIDLTLPDHQRPTGAELFECLFGFPQETYMEWGFSTTANLFSTRETFARVGPFDDRLMSGGDMEWGQRLRAKGFASLYADEVRVSHAARRSLKELLRRYLRIAGGVQTVADHRGEGIRGLPSHAFQQLVKLWRIRANIGDPRLDTIDKKLRFAGVAWFVELAQTIERYRVHYGGRPLRR